VDKALRAIRKTRIRPLLDERMELNGLRIIGSAFPERWQKKDLGPVLKDLDLSKPNILLIHAPTQVETARKAGIALQLSGHTHNGQMFPLKLFTSLIFKGYDYGLHRQGDFSIYTSSGAGTWGPPMRLGSRSEIVVLTLQ